MPTTLLFNKPFNVLCQFRDAQARACLADYIDVDDVYAAGRLDRDSEGLLVLTDDGAAKEDAPEPVTGATILKGRFDRLKEPLREAASKAEDDPIE